MTERSPESPAYARAHDAIVQAIAPSLATVREIYHYTSAEGALGIIEHRTIWATDVRFLNDSSEWAYTLGLAREVRDELTGVTPHSSWGELAVEFERLESLRTYVSCFSVEPDRLSQWRAYSGQGYALGFRSFELAEHFHDSDPKGLLAPVVYDPKVQRNALSGLLENLLPEDPDRLAGDGGVPLREVLVAGLYMAAAFFKHPSFQEEQEWRYMVRGEDGPPTLFRTLRGAVIPYVDVALETAAGFPLSTVIVGPGPDKKMAESGLLELIQARASGVAVRPSSIPYRGP